jgi:hypothetical protein
MGLPAKFHRWDPKSAIVEEVQTFLPYPDFAATAAVLDARRLGKQRVEALQVFRALRIPGYGWRHHPVVRMWTGYDEALVRYGLVMCATWRAAGRADTVAATLTNEYGAPVREQPVLAAVGELPPWLGWEPLHRSHRSALMRKDPAFYQPRFGRQVPTDLPYEWPVSDRWVSREE